MGTAEGLPTASKVLFLHGFRGRLLLGDKTSINMADDDLDFGATIRGFSGGQLVFGRYKLKKILGRGGMGVVWLAHDEDLERDIALKFLPEVVAADAQAIRDLKRETRRSLELTYPHIIRIYDFVKDATNAAISMEFVEGKTLATLRVEQPDGHFETKDVEEWVGQMCDALAYAHRSAQVVHRDLKPANLMIDARGELKVADFGIAASVSDSVSRVSVQAGSSGTPVYMSPQQMMGEMPAVADDIYAFGATVYELLTGRPPFYSGNVMMQVMNKVPPSMTRRRQELSVSGVTIPENWETTVAACLAKEPGDRPKDMAALKQLLLGAQQSSGSDETESELTQEKTAANMANLFSADSNIFDSMFGEVNAVKKGDVTQRIRMEAQDMITGGQFEVPIKQDGVEVKVQVTIPANVSAGTRIRLSGMGNTNSEGTGKGDLYLQLEEPAEVPAAPAEPPPLPKSKKRPQSKGVSVKKLLLGFVILVAVVAGGAWFVDYQEGQRRAAALRASLAAHQLKLSDGVLEVPREFATIDEALDNALEGHTVSLAPGTYDEAITLSRGNNLRGASTSSPSILAVPPNRCALSVNGSEGITVSNLVFRHTADTDGESRTPLISFNDATVRFRNNRVEDAGGYGISIKNGGESTIEDNVITGASWGGILVWDQGKAEIRNNQIIENEGKGIEIRDSAEGVLVFGNQINDNGANGIWIKSPEPVRIIANELARNGNIKPRTGGIGIDAEAKPTLVGNKSSDNDGDGIWWNEGATITMGADNISDGETLSSVK